MLSPCLLSVLLITFLPVSSAMALKRHYRRPTCEPTQSCSYSYQQFTFELCDCPNKETCPRENGVQLKGITYQFCSARQFSICGADEIAAEVNVLQTSIYCVCPESQIYVKQKDSPSAKVKYVCEEKALCEPGQTCGVGSPIVGIKSLCQCAPDHRCLPTMSDVFNPISVQNATCRLQS